MEVEAAESREEQFCLAGVPPGWGDIDLSQLQPPAAPSPPPATSHRSRRRLSGIQPCSSHRMTLRRRSSAAPLSPVERSLNALQLGDEEPPPPVPPDVPSPAPPTEEPAAAARRTGRRRSLVPLNAPPAPASGRKSRRRSFGGRGSVETAGGDRPEDPIELVNRTGKENDWLDVGGSHSPPSQTGLKRNLAAFEADAAAVEHDQRRGLNSTADCSETDVMPVPEQVQDRGDGTARLGTELGDQSGAVDPAVPSADKPRRSAAGRRQRRRSAGGALLAPVETVTSQTPSEAPAGACCPLRSAPAPGTTEGAATANNAGGEVTISAAPPATSAEPERDEFRLPPELEDYYNNRNYEPPAESRLPTIAEEETAAPVRPARGAQRRRADLGTIRKCVMELTPAKQRLRRLKAQRVNGLNRARSRKGRPTSLKMRRLLDARLKELDLFHRETESVAVRGMAAAAAGAIPNTVTGAAESQEVAVEPMDVESSSPSAAGGDGPLPSASPVTMPPAPTLPLPESPPSPLLGPPRPPPPAPLPVLLPDLDATFTCSPARACLTPRLAADGSADSTLSSSGANLLLELTRSSVESLSDGPAESAAGAGAAAVSPVIVGGGELDLAALRRSAETSGAEEAASPCLGSRLDRAVLLSPEDESASDGC